MSKKTIIYAVSSGSYSDYRVDAVFSTKKLAKEFMATVPDGDYNDIEEYELNPKTSNLIKRGYSVWGIIMLRDGTVEEVFKRSNNKYDVMNADSFRIWERKKAPAYKNTNTHDALSADVWAKTERQAVKIVNEKRIQMIANGEWEA